MTSQPTDNELVKQFLEGQSAVFRVLVERHLPALLGFFRYIRVPEEMVDDMMQETFLRAFRHIDRYDSARSSFTTWLTVIGRSIFYTELKKRGRQQPPTPTLAVETTSPDHHQEVVARQSVRELLDSLDEESRFLVELRIFRELPFNEIAEITGDTVVSLRVRFHRTMKRLRVTAQKGMEI